MIAPLFDAPSGLLAIPVGIAFGVTLERAGLGSARTIADQLAARDFTVLKVMFAAIVTAMLGVFWADRFGWLDLSRVAIPSTDVVPQLVGAVLFGAGFAVASLCPGTACVSAATGKRDGLVVIGGLFAGTLIVSLAWPQLGAMAELSPRESATLPGDLGIAPGTVVAVITVIGVGMIWLSDRVTGGIGPLRLSRVSPLAAVALALGTLAAATGRSPLASATALRGIGAEVDSQTDHVDAVVLAEWIRDRKRHLRIIDVRENLAPDDYRIPGAEEVPLQLVPALAVHRGDTVVLYSDGGGHAAQAWMMLRLRGIPDALVLRDGLAAWEDNILAPRFPDASDSAAMSRFERVRELAAYFGGRPSRDAAPPPVAGARSTSSGSELHPRRRKSC